MQISAESPEAEHLAASLAQAAFLRAPRVLAVGVLGGHAMSIIRGPRPESNWYQLDKRISEDARLSWAARGLLVYLLGKPDNWRVSVEHLRKQTEGARIRSGRDAVYALLSELKGAGYIETRQQHRGGRLGPVDYVVRELPDNPEAVQLPAQQDTVRQEAANPTLTKIERAPRTDNSLKTEPSKADARARTFDLSPSEARELVIQRRVEAKRERAEANAQWARENLVSRPMAPGGEACPL